MVRRRAFTLIEVLAAIAIILVISAIVFPVYGHARKRGHIADSTSNVRQIVAALILYHDDNNEQYPMGQHILTVRPDLPTCSKLDTWRSSCDEPFESTMLGSYGYVFALDQFQDPSSWGVWKARGSRGPGSPTLVMDIFVGKHSPKRFSGDLAADEAGPAAADRAYEMPDRVLRGRTDGSAEVTGAMPNIKADWYIASWPLLFTDGL